MPTDEQIKELMEMASIANMFSSIEYDLLRNADVTDALRKIKPMRRELTYEEKQKFYEKLNTPYGL